MDKVVVTGGQGFLGRNLTEYLVKTGADVCSTYSYTPPASNSKSNLNFFRLDVTRFDDCLKLINQEKPKILYHLVAQPLVTSAQKHPFPTLELTIRGAYNLLEAVRQSGTDTHIIVYTTDKVYGENSNAKEGDRIDQVISPYNTAKSCEDLISQMYAKSFGLSVAILRSANLYGRYDLHWDRIVPHVCKELIHNRQPILRSNGHLYRDYIYIDDILEGVLLAAECLSLRRIPSGSIINFGSDISYCALDIVNILLDISGKELLPDIQDKAIGELNYQHINYDFAKSLGWNPKTPLDIGLEKSYQWYQEWFS